MKMVMVSISSIILFIFTGVALESQTPTGPELASKIEGYYKVKSQGANGDVVNGVIQVTHPENTKVYLVRWIDGYSGFGFIQDNRLMVSWTNAKGDIRGLTVLNFSGRNANGVWTCIPGHGQLLKESWSFWAELEEKE